MTLRVPAGKMSNVAPAAAMRAIAIGVGSSRCAEERTPLRTAMESMRMLDRVSSLVPHDRHAGARSATFDRMHLRQLESHESGMCEVKGNRDSRYAARREPVLGKPYVRTHSQRAFRELLQKPLVTAHHPFEGLRETQLTKTQREQTFIAPPGPWGTLDCPVGHPHIQRPSNAQRNCSGAVA